MIWTQLKYFQSHENWGNPYKMNGALLLSFDLMRHFIGFPFVVHCAYELAGHNPKGDHPKGNGIDFHIEGLGFRRAYQKIVDVLEYLQLTNVVSLGLYPEWNNPGFHLGLRGTKARWCQKGGVYLGIDKTFE